MITRKAIIKDIDAWFADPSSVIPPPEIFVGVLVFERLTKVSRGPMRLGVAADEYFAKRFEKLGTTLTMPFTSQPSAAWSGAKCVGLAKTRDEAIALLFGE
mgnify:CR=1 FL=1